MKHLFDFSFFSSSDSSLSIQKHTKIIRYLSSLLIIILVLVFFNCKSFNTDLLFNQESFDKDIKSMHVIVNYESIQTCFPDMDNKEIIKIIKNNLNFETDPQYSFLSVILRKRHTSENRVWRLSLITLVPVLLGIPIESDTTTVELSAAIMNSGGKILKKYKATGIDTEYAALYWGDWYVRTSAYRAITMACKDLRSQLKTDVNNIERLVK